MSLSSAVVPVVPGATERNGERIDEYRKKVLGQANKAFPEPESVCVTTKALVSRPLNIKPMKRKKDRVWKVSEMSLEIDGSRLSTLSTSTVESISETKTSQTMSDIASKEKDPISDIQATFETKEFSFTQAPGAILSVQCTSTGESIQEIQASQSMSDFESNEKDSICDIQAAFQKKEGSFYNSFTRSAGDIEKGSNKDEWGSRISLSKQYLQKALDEIARRQTTNSEVEHRIQMLLNDLDQGLPEEVLKKLIRDEVKEHAQAKKWKKLAILGVCASMVLLLCMCGLSLYSQVTKEVHVKGNDPVMTDGEGAIVATAVAQRRYGLNTAPALPPHMLQTVTEITFDHASGATISASIIKRYILSTGVLFQDQTGDFLYVHHCGASFFIGNSFDVDFNSTEEEEVMKSIDFLPSVVDDLVSSRHSTKQVVFRICGTLTCARISSNDPTEEELKASLAQAQRRLHPLPKEDPTVDADEICGNLKCPRYTGVKGRILRGSRKNLR